STPSKRAGARSNGRTSSACSGTCRCRPRCPPSLACGSTRGGDVWIEEYRPPWEEGDGRWLVFGAGGRLRARVTMPAGFEPTQIGPDFVLGIARDEFDVEQLRLYRLHRSGAPRRPDRAAGS